ncbi:hypothetical protein Tco_0896387 [Tanacetum coccineum]
MKGGIRIEGDEITIYKKVINQDFKPKPFELLDKVIRDDSILSLVDYNHPIPNQEGSRAFQEQFKPVIDRLKQQGYIGEEPLKHWKKNGELCKLDIINPDVTIEDKPLKHVTPAMEDLFRKHVDSLLKIGAIRPSKSRHRTMAMIVNSGTTIDPATGREVKGKERMVFNYKSLNDNTYKDQYSLPGINTIIKRIGSAKIFSKFDLKSGFHQVAMDEESIPWIAFLVPGGLDLDDNWDIVSADFDDSSVYSISEGEGDTHQSISVMVQDTPVEETVFMAIEAYESDDDLEEEDNQFGHHAFMFHPGPPTKIAEMVQSVGSWKPNKELPAKSKNCYFWRRTSQALEKEW